MNEELPEGVSDVDFGEDKVALRVLVPKLARGRDEGGKNLTDIAGRDVRSIRQIINGEIPRAIRQAPGL